MPRFFYALFCVTLLQANPMQTLKTWTKEFLNAQTKENTTLLPKASDDPAYKLEFAPYTLLYALGSVGPNSGVCLGVLFKGQLFKGFCAHGVNVVHLSKDRETLRLELLNRTPATPTTAPKETGYTLTFGLIKGTFYLTSLARLNQPPTYYSTAPTYAMGTINDALLDKLTTPPPPLAQAKVPQPTPSQSAAFAPKIQTANMGAYSLSTIYGPKEQCVEIKEYDRARGRFCLAGAGVVGFKTQGPYLELHLKPADAPAFILTFESVEGDLELKRYTQGSQVFYNQSKDDPHNTHPLPLSALTPKFLQGLKLR
ncbi:hypothetical protein [Helicobacter ailurogastricus]|uniref:hypothetical protein n=1 Tax=Helicobacter ailurogastricus TaxID=1578720 RepID=UPI000CF19955|nr:hypothetical protein [Helicobacter ailurogastricus]